MCYVMRATVPLWWFGDGFFEALGEGCREAGSKGECEGVIKVAKPMFGVWAAVFYGVVVA